MPMFDYACSCGRVQTDIIFVRSDKVLETIGCDKCGGTAKQMLPLIARTDKSWGETHAHFDRGLGAMVKNRQDRERIAKAKGLVPMEDLPRHYWEDNTAKRKDKLQAQNQVMDRYQTALKKHGGDKLKAIPEALPAHQCLSGELDSTFKE